MTAKERVEVERKELAERLEKLKNFLKSGVDKLPIKQYTLLVRQEAVMESYLSILDRRLEIWDEVDSK